MKISTSSSSLFNVLAFSAAALAGYVIVLSTGPIGVGQLINDLDPDNAALWTSIAAAGAALVIAISYVVFGRLSTRLLKAYGSRQRIFVMAALLTAPLGLLVAWSNSIQVLLIAWFLLQVPAAALLSVATAMALELVPPNRVGLASGLFGAASVVALWFGAVLNVASGFQPAIALTWAFAISTFLILPAALTRENSTLNVEQSAAKTRTKLPPKFGTYLFAMGALMAQGTILVDYAFRIGLKLTSASEASQFASALSSMSSGALLVGSIAGGLLSTKIATSHRIFTYSIPLAAAGVLAELTSTSTTVVTAGAIITGLAVGLNIGAQLPVLKTILATQEVAGREAGIYNLVSVLPGIAVPAIAAVMIAINPETWMPLLGLVLAAIALVGAALARTLSRKQHSSV